MKSGKLNFSCQERNQTDSNEKSESQFSCRTPMQVQSTVLWMWMKNISVLDEIRKFSFSGKERKRIVSNELFHKVKVKKYNLKGRFNVGF